MKFMYLLGICISTYYFMRWIKKKQRLHLLISDNKFTLIFQLMSSKFFENLPKSYLLTGHIQTFLLEIGNNLIELLKRFFRIFTFKYQREIFTLEDGAKIAVDHAISVRNPILEDCKRSLSENSSDSLINFNNKKIKKFENSKKILLIVPGVTSSSEELYIKLFVEDFISEFDCRVINSRGIGGMKLYNEKMICPDLYHDLWNYLQKLCLENKGKKVFAIGFSYGGHILTRCLAEYTKALPSNFIAGCGICYPTSVEKTERFLDKFYGIYNRSIVNNIKKIFLRNVNNIFDETSCKKNILVKKEELIKIMQNVKTMREYSINYLVDIQGYKNHEEYYESCDLKNHVEKIRVPYLSWFTEDDPIVPISAVPFENYQNNPNTVTIVSEHGGHLGLISGTLIPKRIIKEPIMNFFKLIDILRDYK